MRLISQSDTICGSVELFSTTYSTVLSVFGHDEIHSVESILTSYSNVSFDFDHDEIHSLI